MVFIEIIERNKFVESAQQQNNACIYNKPDKVCGALSASEAISLGVFFNKREK